MKLIDTKNAEGHVLCHDLTQIIPGVVKDARFRKGHIVKKEDISVLLSMGKEHLYIWEKAEGMLHEDEAVEYLRSICQNEWMHATETKEGKIELIADCDGLFLVDVERLRAVNSKDDVIIATKHTNTVVHNGDKLAGMRVIPLVIAQQIMQEVCEAAGDTPLLKIIPWKRRTCGIVTTGSEVAKGIIEDKFTPVVIDKLCAFGIEVTNHCYAGDDTQTICKAILDCKAAGVDMILCTGGMSVDPDDKTPGAIKASGADVICYGAPVLPGAMFSLAYFADGTPVMGLPGCVMYAKTTIFDLVLPRITADIPITKHELKGLGHGGLCLNCPVCHYPNCSFGKGV